MSAVAEALAVPAGEMLPGREVEIGLLENMLVEAGRGHGGALIVRGPAGTGKSSLLRAVRTTAAGRQWSILCTRGAESEMELAFAGLHQLLRPVLGRVDGLCPRQRSALRAAVGLQDPSSAPDVFGVGLATLELLGEVITDGCLVLLIDDLQWLDHPTIDVLSFVARRINNESILMLFAERMSGTQALGAPDLPARVLEKLDDETAGSVVDAIDPDLPTGARDRILSEADGNPLALVELARTPRPALVSAGALGAALPLGQRLERAFAARFEDLPIESRALLLAAAADAQCAMPALLSVASTIAGRPIAITAAQPAIDAGLARLDTRIRFGHPLMSSAIYQRAAIEERLLAHSALAELSDDPDRQAWHWSSAALGPDEEIADALEACAGRAEQRGAASAAVSALIRAAELTTGGRRRTARFLRAAELACETGRSHTAVDLIKRSRSWRAGSAGSREADAHQGSGRAGGAGESGAHRLTVRSCRGGW